MKAIVSVRDAVKNYKLGEVAGGDPGAQPVGVDTLGRRRDRQVLAARDRLEPGLAGQGAGDRDDAGQRLAGRQR
ncbi:MAG: hypothetical protein ACJ8F1_15345, partial [Polyangia bacterium]